MLKAKPLPKEYYEERVKQFKKKGDFRNMIFIDPRREEYWRRTNEILKAIIRPGDKVLDVGCGYGRVYPIIKEITDGYEGIDFCKEMIKLAREKYPDGTFYLIDDANTFIPDKKYDVIFHVNALGILGDQEKWFKKWKDFTKRSIASLDCDEFLIYNLYEDNIH